MLDDDHYKNRSASGALLYGLAEQGRLVLSDWRAMILLRRAAFSVPEGRRRWATFPGEPRETWPILRRMNTRGDLRPLRGFRHFYRVSVPYATRRALDEREVLLEAHPYASLGFLSAFFYHGLTEVMPKVITALYPRDGKGGELPLDTDADDWEGLDLPKGRRVGEVLDLPVEWHGVSAQRYFGFRVYRGQGLALRVTTPERTLVDGIRHPELCGGMENVLRGWAGYADLLDADLVVFNVERLGEGILKQRAGFVLDRLGIAHPALEEWRAGAKRGGSSKLLASAPYSPRYDEGWNLSINTPVDTLTEGTALLPDPEERA